MKTKMIVLMMFAVVYFTACSSDDLPNETGETPNIPTNTDGENPVEPVKPRQDIVLTEMEQTIAAGNNAFAFELLRTATADAAANDNLLLSPLSLTLALTMLDNGADGVTHEEIRTALGYGIASRDDVNGYFRKMVDALTEADNYAVFESANSIWIADNLPVYDNFKTVNREAFDAEALAFDPTDPEGTLKRINEWCAEKTHNLIPRLLDNADPATVTYLINALYFKASWRWPFDRQITAEATFRNADGTTSKQPMMQQTFNNLNYVSTEAFEAVELPYGNGSFGLTLLLPSEDRTVASVVDALDAVTWNNCRSQLYSTPVDIRLPRFKTEYTRKLNSDLEALGITTMFSADASFPFISPNALFVSLVLQKTFLSIDEEGSEAAAATAINMQASHPDTEHPAQPRVLEFNRPFIYLITERSTGSIIFVGITNNL
jgi:serpin B